MHNYKYSALWGTQGDIKYNALWGTQGDIKYSALNKYLHRYVVFFTRAIQDINQSINFFFGCNLAFVLSHWNQDVSIAAVLSKSELSVSQIVETTT